MTERIDIFKLTDTERTAVLASLLKALDMQAIRVTAADAPLPLFGVLSVYKCATAVPPVNWAKGHEPRTT